MNNWFLFFSNSRCLDNLLKCPFDLTRQNNRVWASIIYSSKFFFIKCVIAILLSPPTCVALCPSGFTISFILGSVITSQAVLFSSVFFMVLFFLQRGPSVAFSFLSSLCLLSSIYWVRERQRHYSKANGRNKSAGHSTTKLYFAASISLM